MLVLGVGIAQLATPLAWMLSPGLMDAGEWHNLYLFEAGLALCSLAAVVVLKLPPGIHIKVFEPLDFLTFGLMAPGAAMLVAVLAQGYVRWWFDTPWLAWLLAGAFLLRFLTSEQTYGAVGLLRTLGMGPDQLQALFTVVLAGTVCGIPFSAATFSPKTMIGQILLAIVLFGAAAWIDYGRSSLDRPHDFYASQFVLALGAGMFMGPLIMLGFGLALRHGAGHIVTFSVMLSMAQSLGGFSASAALSTYQLHREHVYSSAIVASVNPADPVVAQRLRAQQQIYQGTVADPVLRNAQGTALLAQTARREANVRAFNDVFALSGVMAVLFLLWSLFVAARARRRMAGAA